MTEDIREKVIWYIKERGMKQSWFYNQLPIKKSHFSMWINGQRNLSKEIEEQVNEILSKL